MDQLEPNRPFLAGSASTEVSPSGRALPRIDMQMLGNLEATRNLIAKLEQEEEYWLSKLARRREETGIIDDDLGDPEQQTLDADSADPAAASLRSQTEQVQAAIPSL
ncbi:hypothetical protein WJX74_010655 [Apatococcus lobatus]|uniref:Uncharacterized protein n=1 Tax=Apatococcus lobatus TaxID=904363 RepID=A0AAW1RZC0_9CHLO